MPFALQIKGQSVDDFISQAQDRTRNAKARSELAGFNMWKEQLQSDQVQFEASKIMSEKESAKKRAQLVSKLEDAHKKAWDAVGSYMSSNLQFFEGRAIEAESTVLPALSTWMTETLGEIAEVRSPDDHCIFLLINLPTAGVVPAAKSDFFLTAVTNILASYSKNSIAIFVHGNRAGDASGRRGVKSEKVEKDEMDEDVKEEDEGEEDEDGEGEENMESPEEVEIREMKHRLEKALSLKDRGLVIKDLTWVFDPASIYGKRSGCLRGLAVLHRDKANVFRSSQGWKHAVIHQVQMLPRNGMYKPDAQSALPHMGRAFTDAQELRQVSGGCDFVRKTMDSFKPATASTCLIVDLHGYDCWPALAALEERSEGHRTICATVVLDRSSQSLQSRVANKLYESCRAGHVEVCGFPQYSHLVSALQNIQTEESQVSYQVCVKRHDRLLVLSALASKFLECEDLKDDAKSLIEQHNANYNPDGDWLAEPEPTRTPMDDETGRPHKRIKLEQSELATPDDVVNLSKPQRMEINNTAELVVGQEGSPLYLVTKDKNQFLQYRELFLSFHLEAESGGVPRMPLK
ncbi:unnamed protein product [Cladocopium goreaui]|uniref:Uncharacterized protein n=1 Tax=Cladocopium goreaui TaxID=2562237 RepID=A0A9P1CST9_9DINO|nr:unnamed protein product [Cladocopium goreaui]